MTRKKVCVRTNPKECYGVSNCPTWTNPDDLITCPYTKDAVRKMRTSKAIDPAKFPLLAQHIAKGQIWEGDYGYIGLALDGVEVSIGEFGNEFSLECYLTDSPNPSDW